MTDRRAILAGLSGILAGCRGNPEEQAPSVDLNSEEIQTAMKALIDSVETLQTAVAGFGAANCKDVAVQVKSAATDVNNNLAGLRQALGLPDSN
jgi:uncharacterized protein YukE